MRLSAFLILTAAAPPDPPAQAGTAPPKSIDELKGFSSDGKFQNAIEVVSYSYRFHHDIGADGAAVAHTVPDYLYVIKPVDRASPFLFQTAKKPKAEQLNKVKGAILCVCRPGVGDQKGLEVFWRIELTNPWITSIAQVGDPVLHPLQRNVTTHLAVPSYGPLEEVSLWADNVRFFYEPDAAVAGPRAQSAAIPVPPPRLQSAVSHVNLHPGNPPGANPP